MYKVIAVCVANLTGLEKCPWCHPMQFVSGVYGLTALLCTRDGNHMLWLYIKTLFFPPGWMTQVCRHKACKLNGGKKIAKCELCSYFHSRTLNYGFKYTQH